MDQMDNVRNQVRSVVRSKTTGAVTRLRSETSLVKQARKLSGQMVRKGDELVAQVVKGPKGRRASAGETVAEVPAPVRPAPDGYVRRSPVQPIHTAADYKARIAKKLVSGCILVVVLAVAVWLLLKTQLLAF